MKIEYEFYQQTGSVWEPTDLRPSSETWRHLEAEAQRKMAKAMLHEPGMGWHFLPGAVVITYNGNYWYDSPVTSESAILAHCEDLCLLKGVDLAALYAEAYPEEEPLAIAPEGHAQCARAAGLDDLEAILEDLTDINYHSLRTVLERSLGA